ncbi:MAG: twin-arginine translocation signal domain-containing protein, partial [Nodosilinea sp.]
MRVALPHSTNAAHLISPLENTVSVKRLLTSPYSRRQALSRRRFLQGSAAVVAGLTAANCRQNLAGPSSNSGGSDGTLHIYTWANYTDDSLAEAFT